MKLKDLLEKRDQLLAEARTLLDRAKAEDRALTEEERQRFDQIEAQLNELRETIEREVRLKSLESSFQDSLGRKTQDQVVQGDALIGMSERDLRHYSLLRAIRAAAEGDWSKAPLEREASEATAEKLGRSPQGFFVPPDWLIWRGAFGREQRLSTTGGGTGLVETQFEGASFIDMLRARPVVSRAGARVMGDLVGKIEIPRQIGGATTYWIGEATDVTLSDLSTDKVTLDPKTVAAAVPITRSLIKQTSLDVERLVRDDLVQAIALAIDYAALHGDGAGNSPTGIASTTGVAVVSIGTDGGAPTWAHIVQLETEVAIDNADVGALAYITNPKVRGKLKTTEKASGTAQFIWEGDTVNGYRAFVSTQVRSDLTKGTGTNLSAIFFGNWNDLLIGNWGALDLVVDTSTYVKQGGLLLLAFQDVDIAVRHAESFSMILDAATN